MKHLRKEVKDVYTAFLVKFSLVLPVGADITKGPIPFLKTVYAAGIKTRAYSYQAIPLPTGGYEIAFVLVVCSTQLAKVQPLIGYPGKTSGTLDLFPGLAPLSVYYSVTADVTVSIVIEEMLIFKTRASPSLELRKATLDYIIGSGFSPSVVAILGKNFLITSTPRDIRADNNGKLMIGAILPILGISCYREKMVNIPVNYPRGKKKCC